MAYKKLVTVFGMKSGKQLIGYATCQCNLDAGFAVTYPAIFQLESSTKVKLDALGKPVLNADGTEMTEDSFACKMSPYMAWDIDVDDVSEFYVCAETVSLAPKWLSAGYEQMVKGFTNGRTQDVPEEQGDKEVRHPFWSGDTNVQDPEIELPRFEGAPT